MFHGLRPTDYFVTNIELGNALHATVSSCLLRGTHFMGTFIAILGYLVPGDNNDVRPGFRLYTWAWYRVADPAQLGLRRQGMEAGNYLLFHRLPATRIG